METARSPQVNGPFCEFLFSVNSAGTLCQTLLIHSGDEFGSNPTEISMLSSFSAPTNTHCFTAFTAQSERIGFPPNTCTSFTDPFGFTSTLNFTVPPIPLRFSTEGYCAATDFNTFRLDVTSCATLNPALAAPNTAPASIPRIFLELFFIVFRPSLLCRTGGARHTSRCPKERA